MKKLFFLLFFAALASCQHEYHVKAQVTFQNGQRDTIEYTYFGLQEYEVFLDEGDVYVYRNGVIASGARSFKLLNP